MIAMTVTDTDSRSAIHHFPNSIRNSGTAWYQATRFIVSKLVAEPAQPMDMLIYQPKAGTYTLLRWPGQDIGPFRIEWHKEQARSGRAVGEPAMTPAQLRRLEVLARKATHDYLNAENLVDKHRLDRIAREADRKYETAFKTYHQELSQ